MAQWLVAVGFICAGGFIIVMNWGIFIRWLTTKKHSSSAPLVGAVLAGLGIAWLPSSAARAYWWLPFLIDIGSIPMLVFATVIGLRYLLKKK
jgi:DNA-binding transcriptional LysR family regulator